MAVNGIMVVRETILAAGESFGLPHESLIVERCINCHPVVRA